MEDNENLNDLASGQEFVSGQKIVVGDPDEEPENLNEFDNAVAGTVKGRGKKKREVALVYDRYYEKTPRTRFILGAKVLFCCALSVCSMMFVLSNLDMPIDMRMAALVCFGCTAAFSALFLYVRKTVVLPVAVLVCSVVVWHNKDLFWDKLSWFTDAMILQLDGRLMQTREQITHKLLLPSSASGTNSIIDPFYADKLVFGIVLVCMLYSMIVSASMFRKPHVMPILIVFLAMWTPRMIAERMLFNLWLIPTAALFAGAMCMTISQKDGLAIRQGFAHSYRGIVARNEHLFNMRTENSAYMRKTALRGAYNSKYFTLAMCSSALFLAAIVSANAIAGDSRGIDYSKLYAYLAELGSSGFGVTSPFKSGPVSEYFTNPNKSDFDQGSGLSITNPGKGEQEIMRVKNLGTLPMYLRGDIGMEFDGKNWTSPVGGVPKLWEQSLLDKWFSPSELITLYAFGDPFGMEDCIEKAELSIDYLCDTNIVFAPAYIDYYDSYVDNELFTVYGDYAIRTTEKAGKLGSMRGYAYTPVFMGIEDMDRAEATDAVRSAANVYRNWSLYADYAIDPAIYADYVREIYMGVPEQLKEPIAQYIVDNLLDIPEVAELSRYGYGDCETEYAAALAVADYLRDNYVYSLNARVSSRDPVMSFLNDTKSGHCALYASSMAMIMRTLGVPARYCTGFAAKPTDSAGAVLRSKNLHAWCEVYFDELGWVTFDPTSSVSIEEALNGTSASSSSSSVSESSSSSSSVPESSDSEVREPSDSVESGLTDSSAAAVAGEKVDIMPYVLTIGGIAAGIAVIVFAAYRIRRFDKNAKKAMRKFYTAENSQSVYARLLAVLRLCKIVPNGGELTGDFFKRAGRELGCPIYKHIDLLERLAFGGGELSDTEKATLARLLEKVFAAANKRLGIIGKTRLRFIMTSKKYRF
ncbi:MAG: transglutaminase domain-containing protein [Ruminococcaceae bacterium]|nr:transglutaminase domain-containing protein [Oscillospiraceae bacterium]